MSWSNPWVVASSEEAEDACTDPSLDVMAFEFSAGRADIHVVWADPCMVLGPAETVQFWTSESYLSEYMEDGTIVVLSEGRSTSGAVVMVSPGEECGEPIVTIKETYDVRKASVRVTMRTSLETFEETWQAVHDTLRIDQKRLLRGFSQDVLQAVLS